MAVSALHSTNPASQSNTTAPQNQTIDQIIGNTDRTKAEPIDRKEYAKSPLIITILAVIAVVVYVLVR